MRVFFFYSTAMYPVHRQIDGGQHEEATDRHRTEALEARGYRLLRFWNSDVLTNLEGVIEVVRSALAETKK